MDISITDLVTTFRGVLGGIISGGIIVFGFLSRFQTKSDCKIEHTTHDTLVKKDNELLDSRFKNVELKIENMEKTHGIELKAIRESTERQEKLVGTIAKKVWE